MNTKKKRRTTCPVYAYKRERLGEIDLRMTLLKAYQVFGKLIFNWRHQRGK
jgi:hypothetical protein